MTQHTDKAAQVAAIRARRARIITLEAELQSVQAQWRATRIARKQSELYQRERAIDNELTMLRGESNSNTDIDVLLQALAEVEAERDALLDGIQHIATLWERFANSADIDAGLLTWLNTRETEQAVVFGVVKAYKAYEAARQKADAAPDGA